LPKYIPVPLPCATSMTTVATVAMEVRKVTLSVASSYSLGAHGPGLPEAKIKKHNTESQLE
jgi:hypothetical protein